MKSQSYSIIFFLIFSLNLLAQTEPETVRKKILDPKDRILVDFNYDSFTHFPAKIAQKAYSLGGNVYFMWDYPFGYGPFSIAFGAGFSTHDVHTNGKIVYSLDGKYTSFEPIYNTYNTNKLSLNYFEIPVELRIRTRGNHNFKLCIGGKGGYAFNVHTKYEDAEGKIKVYKIKNINLWRYGATFRIGYDRYNIQVFYALSELFVKGKGEPGMVPFSAGIGLLLY
ncbi:MAG: hypothetical protein K0S44_1177 [Bacteroidetes bacterium]|jgi:hypothetical protein|nr:hypothetical protein [Bacteroidota bacterium]